MQKGLMNLYHYDMPVLTQELIKRVEKQKMFQMK